MLLNEFNTFCGQYENIFKAFGALAPLVGTALLAYIAYQQWQTNERKRRQELFEMRYEKLFIAIYKMNDENFTEKNRTEALNAIAKYKYLIKEKDFSQLLLCVSSIKIYPEKKDFYLSKLLLLMEKYLRIEPEYTLWGIIINFIIGTYEFLAPKGLQNFIQNQIETSIMLDLFQHLTNKEQKSTAGIK